MVNLCSLEASGTLRRATRLRFNDREILFGAVKIVTEVWCTSYFAGRDSGYSRTTGVLVTMTNVWFSRTLIQSVTCSKLLVEKTAEVYKPGPLISEIFEISTNLQLVGEHCLFWGLLQDLVSFGTFRKTTTCDEIYEYSVDSREQENGKTGDIMFMCASVKYHVQSGE